MNSNLFNKQHILYADGSEELGYGHLMRVLNLSKILKIVDSSIFIFDNLDQKNFYELQKVVCINKNNLPKKNYQLLIVDSKVDQTNLIRQFQNSVMKILVIDNLILKKNLYDFMVLPSFFENAKDRGVTSSIEEKVFLGSEYLILNPRISDVQARQKKEFITISFGGSDPNNLTLFVLTLLKKNIPLNNILVILGPGYKHDRSLIEKIVNKKQIINNPKNIYDIFVKSFFVITAFGVTLQELFYLGISAGIVANYKSDFDDYLRIEKYFQSVNERNLFCYLGTLQEINKDMILKAISTSKNIMQSSKTNKNYGSGWEVLRNKLLS